MAEHSNSGADPRSAGEDEFAVSEHGFTEKLNTETSSETRDRLEDMGQASRIDGARRAPHRSGDTASRVIGEIQTFTRRQPLEALLGAFVAGVVLGLFARR
jgi:hypothetical protein